MIVIVCAKCGLMVNAQTTRRRYCSQKCRKKAQYVPSHRIPVAERLEDFLMIAGTDSWENIATRLGFSNVRRLREWVRARGELRWADRITADGLAERERQGKWAA